MYHGHGTETTNNIILENIDFYYGPTREGCLPENCPFTTTNLPSVNVPVFAGIFIKVSDLMQIADDMGCMNPSATCGCTFCLLESQHWGAVDSKLNFKPKIKTVDLINQIVDDREPYLARQQQKNPKSPITDDQKHSVIAKSGVYSKDVATKFGSSLLEASVLPSFQCRA